VVAREASEWKLAEQRGEQQQAAIAVLNVGGMDDGVQQPGCYVVQLSQVLCCEFFLLVPTIDGGFGSSDGFGDG
jgi:hypothetical protein